MNVKFYMGDGTPSTVENGAIYVDKTSNKMFISPNEETLIQFTGKNILPSRVLANNDWTTIKEVCNAGTAANYWNVGDEITITTTDNKEITMVILGFNHDDKADGSGKANVTFGMKNLLADYYAMDSNDATDGWENCDMRKTTMSELYNKLPDEVKAAITPVTKKTCRGYTSSSASFSSTLVTTTDSLFLFSEKEIYGTNNYSGAGEGTQYAYYLNGGADTGGCDICTKYMNNGSGDGNYWWLRSPNSDDYYYFCRVYYSGYLYYGIAYTSYGVCFGFAV